MTGSARLMKSDVSVTVNTMQRNSDMMRGRGGARAMERSLGHPLGFYMQVGNQSKEKNLLTDNY